MTYLASSKLSLAVLGNLGFACTLCTYKLITKVPGWFTSVVSFSEHHLCLLPFNLSQPPPCF